MVKAGSAIFRDVLRDARKQLLLDYEKSEGFGHSGIKGDERAEALASFLQTRLPPAFGIATGEAIDRYDSKTGQLDIIIYDRTATQPVHAGRRSQIHPCEAVYAVIEVKSVLNRTHVKTCVTAADKIRRLRPFNAKFVDARKDGAPAAKSDEHRCMFIAFGYATDLAKTDWLQKEYDRLAEVATEENASLSNIDRLVVLDRGLINCGLAVGKEESDPVTLFMEFFLNLVNFIERERERRPVMTWQDYAQSGSRGWKKLTRS